ncbi:MAG: hypothetical protein OEN23_07760 [Paracoccaceae bacterium]|nr:hypothetical protein [Paracoccaceae bacterium]
MRQLIALVSGALFALGLIVSDMVNPARVLGFLDVAGAWDPTLAFVMGGALVPMAIAWRLATGGSHPLVGGDFPGRASPVIDTRLIGGAALFGAGWGLVGFCPGPALTALGTGNAEAMVFTAAMITGMFGYALTAPSPRGI